MPEWSTGALGRRPPDWAGWGPAACCNERQKKAGERSGRRLGYRFFSYKYECVFFSYCESILFLICVSFFPIEKVLMSYMCEWVYFFRFEIFFLMCEYFFL